MNICNSDQENKTTPTPNSTLITPQSNPNPYPNSITSFQSQTLNPIPSYVPSLSVPRKRRQAGRRPNTAPFNPAPPPVHPQNFDMSDDIIVINKDSTAEAITALSVGFPADVLTDEEIDAGVVSVVGGIEQVNYILIRNHIITRWRENVFAWLTKQMFFNVVPSHCKKLLDSAYEYLDSRGYINFGVAREIKMKTPSEPSKPSVIIIGAGLAGLAAARQLLRFGFKVTVLEGRKRAGGRVYTRKLEGGNKSAAADLGGSVLTGTLGNPLGILARQLSSSLHKVRDKCPLYRLDGKPVDLDMDLKVEHAFNRILDRASHLRQLMGESSRDISLGSALETFKQDYGDAVNEEELNLFNWHLANLEYANAGLLRKLSLAFWDQDDPYDMGGDHCFLPGGNGRLVQALAENVPILYEKIVNTIRYSGNGVQVVAGTQVFEGDMALCTVPLGVLKSGSIKFIPELPQKKLDGIKRLGFGLLNKVAMLFPDVFWGTDLDTFGHLTDDSSRRGEFFLFYSYATVAGGALLIALVAGEAAHTFESMHPTDAVTRVLQILRDIYEPQGITVPEPIQTVCTRWGNDPFSLGSYSNVAVGSSGDDYDILAENVGDGRVFFAGEATNRRYPATMHGAFLSGLREAAHMARYADVRTLKKKIEKKTSKNPYSQASLLADLFREPDIEFGNYAIIYDRRNTDPKSLAVLRVTFSGPRDQQHSNNLLFQQLQSHFNQKQEFHIYRLLPLEQALELREVRGGNDARLYFLTDKLGVNLIRRKGLGPNADSVISSIKAERGTRKYASTSLTLKSGLTRPKAASTKQKLVRRAKIMRSTNGASASCITKGAKPVGTAVVPLSLSNQDVGSQVPTAGNLNGGNSGVSVSHTVEEAKPVVIGVVPLSSPDQDVGSLIPKKEEIFDSGTYPPSIGVGYLAAENSSNSTAAVDTRPMDCLDGTGVVPLSSPNQDLGSSSPKKEEILDSGTYPPSIGVGDAGNSGNFIAAIDTRPMDCLDGSGVVPLSSPNQVLGSWIPKREEILDSGTYLPSIVVGDIFAGNSGNSTAAIDTRPMDCLDGNGFVPLASPNQDLGSFIPKKEVIFDSGTYLSSIGVGDIFAGNSGNSTAAINTRPMDCLDGSGVVPLSSLNQNL